jgi:thiamine biosynthesis lipoprotein
MGGPCLLVADTVKPLDNALLNGLEREIERLEQKYSRYRPDSLLSQVNAAAGSGTPVAIDPETAGLCRYLDQLYRDSDGLFDATSGALRRAWDFRSGQLPDASTLDSLLPLIDWPAVEWTERKLALPRAGMELDLGGLVKEYAVDCGARYLDQQGIRHALFDMAGDLATLGTQGDGTPWPVAIRHPRQQGRPAARLALTDQRLASSGDYERCMVIDGQRYSHHLNPHDGHPVKGLLAVSVLGEQCLLAGSVATVAMLQDSAKAGTRWLQDSGLPWLAVDADLRLLGPLVDE